MSSKKLTNKKERANARLNSYLEKSGMYGVCKSCGKTFKQEYIPSMDRYTKMSFCTNCRSANLTGTRVYEIPYTPHKAQELVHNSKARFKVLCCGNRFGKDLCAIADSIKNFINMLNEDRPPTMNPSVHWWIIAPTNDLAKQNWRDLMTLLPRDLVMRASQNDMLVETVGNGVIEVRSGYDPNMLVGVGLDIATMTEAARFNDLETTWTNILQRLSSPGRGPKGKGGVAIVNSTPNYSNPRSNKYFQKIFFMGDKESSYYVPTYESFHFTTWDNPYMGEKRFKNIAINADGIAIGEPMTFEESIKRGITDEKYRQDYLAEFVLDGNAAFHGVDDVMVKAPPQKTVAKIFYEDIAEVKRGESYIIGYDPASKKDGHPIVVFDGKGNMVQADPMTALGWESQWDKIKRYSDYYNNAEVRFGEAGVGQTIRTALESRGIIAVPVQEGGQNSKRQLVEKMAYLIETKKVTFLDVYDIYNQLVGYSKKVSASGNTVRYENGIGVSHDDWVSAIYIALSGFEEATLRRAYFDKIL